ncbi:diacylglycerol kinase family protein [Thermaerobacillus caldiproteolyticus]|uniref:diacylglycerol kinase family protein n=1 Tax=Thermaerobacillus caldiproteolyticus TaxID=247480 RepID=UPI00188AC2E2|nr:diacylglycerol kinase family protein [Anoxybacillus caldiproteolyticus]QPA30114.1 diacylglycerol kinase family protein [Anoxybacillus caldiproteolyticus]
MRSWKREAKSFVYAWTGIVMAIKEESHMKVHLFFAFIAIVAAFIVNISKTEWLILLVTIGMVISLEMVNTALERVVDLTTQELHPLAKAAKDIAAGAVLVGAMISVIIGIIIFLPYII